MACVVVLDVSLDLLQSTWIWPTKGPWIMHALEGMGVTQHQRQAMSSPLHQEGVHPCEHVSYVLQVGPQRIGHWSAGCAV